MIFPAISIYGWDFPWRTVSHNQRVTSMFLANKNLHLQAKFNFNKKRIVKGLEMWI
jgi:hypothetical protein